MKAPDRVLADLAASVADGAPVDWTALDRHGAHFAPPERRLVKHLRLVESIANVHRSIQPEPEELIAPEPPAAQPDGRSWGRLILRDSIGRGTSCEVFRAWDVELHRDVALKLLHEDVMGTSAAHARMLEEARRLARIRHPHVVQVYGAEQHDGRVGLWMELVRGESLDDLVRTRGPFGDREATLVALDLCAALAAVHGARLLHRDVKAQNVLRESGGRLVLMDFGTGEELVGTNRMIGTPLYLAPEIFRGQPASVQSDLYSLGVLLYYLVTGRFPVNAGSMEQLGVAHANRERQPLRDLRPDLAGGFIAVVERALDGDPARRFRTTGEMESALRESLGSQPAPAVPHPLPAPTPPAGHRARWLGLATAAALVLMIGLAASGLLPARLLPEGWGPPATGSQGVRRLAVLPLRGTLPPPAGDTLDGMTAQLISALGQVESLTTTAFTVTAPLRGSSRSAAEIASTLGVDAALEGVVTVSGGDALRLEATLIAAGSGARIWSGTFERQRGEISGLLGTVARELARASGARVSAAETARLQQSWPTKPAAEAAYFRGQSHLAQYGVEPAKRALAAFQTALGIDPDYPAAHAGAALAYVQIAGSSIGHPEARQNAEAEIRAAERSGLELADTHAAKGRLRYLYDGDWDGAAAAFERALQLNPGLVQARHSYAQLLAARQQFDEALRISDGTRAIEAHSDDVLVNHGLLLYYRRDFAAAQAIAERVLGQRPGYDRGHVLHSRVLEAQGRYPEALAAARRVADLSGERNVPLQVAVIRLQALVGQRQEAEAAAAALAAAGQQGTAFVGHRDLAYLELGFGNIEAALTAFEAALAQREPSLVWLGVDPRVDPLRSHPRFKKILETLKL